jgi:hypothetical protein
MSRLGKETRFLGSRPMGDRTGSLAKAAQLRVFLQIWDAPEAIASYKVYLEP